MMGDTDALGLSWYELCVLITATRLHKVRSTKEQERRVRKLNRDCKAYTSLPYQSRIDALEQMETTLTSFERRLAKRYGFDPTEPSRIEHALKLDTGNVVELKFKEVVEEANDE